MYLVLSGLTSSPISLAAATRASAFSFRVCVFPPSILTYIHILIGDRSSTVAKVLCYNSEGHWFDPRWCHWDFSLT